MDLAARKSKKLNLILSIITFDNRFDTFKNYTT